MTILIRQPRLSDHYLSVYEGTVLTDIARSVRPDRRHVLGGLL